MQHYIKCNKERQLICNNPYLNDRSPDYQRVLARQQHTTSSTHDSRRQDGNLSLDVDASSRCQFPTKTAVCVARLAADDNHACCDWPAQNKISWFPATAKHLNLIG